MSDKHDPNAGVPIGTFTARTDDGEFEIPIEVVVDDDIEPRQLAMALATDAPQDDALRFSDEPTQNDALPRRKRIATLLGVPLPGTLPDSRDPTKATRGEINAAVDRIFDDLPAHSLDEQPTTIYGMKKRDSDGGLAALESLVESEMVELPPSSPPGEILGVVARTSETGTFQLELRESDGHKVPVLVPSQFVEARDRDRDSQPSAASVPVRDERAARDARDVRDDRKPAEPARSPESIQKEKRRAAAIAAEPVTATAPSSLAPREIARRAPAARRGEPASAAGIGLVAAMVLLGIGGWWWTAGGYQRMATPPAPPAASASTAPSNHDALAAKLPVAPPPPVAPPVVEESPAPTPPPVAPAKPRVASKTVRKVAPPPAPEPTDSMAETPSRSDVLNGLDGVRTSVQACAEGRNGVAEVDLTIAANGIVTNALVGGDFGGTPQGSCIARAVRKARFPIFKQDRYRVLFPYVL